jgi:hypothetical protein
MLWNGRRYAGWRGGAAVAALGVLAALACGEPAPGPAAPFGVAASPWTTATGWQVEEELRLGRLEGTAPDVFGEIRALEVADNGDVLVFDHFAGELRRFDLLGRFVGAFGSVGAGPGEFRGVVGMATGTAGDTWIVDPLNTRYTVIDAEGAVRTIPRVARVGTRPWVGGFDGDGHLHDLATEAAAEGGLTDLILRMSVRDGSIVSRHPLPRTEIPTPTLGFGIMVPVPFAPRMMRAWDPRGGGAVWQALSSEYRITRIDLTGDTTATAVTNRSMQALNPAEQDSLDRAVSDAERRFGITVAARMRPDSIPNLRWFTVDREGHLWVCATGRDPCSTIDVHAPDGGFLGIVALPAPLASAPPPLVRNGRIYGVTDGVLGEPQLFVGRVRRP